MSDRTIHYLTVGLLLVAMGVGMVVGCAPYQCRVPCPEDTPPGYVCRGAR